MTPVDEKDGAHRRNRARFSVAAQADAACCVADINLFSGPMSQVRPLDRLVD
jgi:hypothetical protein